MTVPQSAQVGRMLQYVGRPLLMLVAYDLAVVVAFQVMHWHWMSFPNVPLALLGSAIGVIMGFRNNSAYDRWWEARKLWGTIVNNSRSWARQVLQIDASETDDLHSTQRRMIYLHIAFVHALRQHLRRLEPWSELQRLLSKEELDALRGDGNIPLRLQVQMGKMLRECVKKRWIDPLQWAQMDTTLNDLADAQGGAERIKNTPMPKQYDYFPQLFTHIYCLVLPLALIDSLGWYTPLGSTLVGFIFLALDKIGRDLEDPFENTLFDVPLTSITRGIEINLRQLLDEKDIPSPEQPIHGVLW
jgi:putative membrane protein